MSNTIDIRDHIRELNARTAAQPPRPVPRPPPAPAGPSQPDPVASQIAALNAQRAARQPRPRPAPAPVGPSRLDQAAAERDPATQHVRGFNAKAAAEAKQRAERDTQAKAERERNAQIAAEIIAAENARAEHEQRIQQAIRELAEAHLRKQERHKS